MKIFIKKLLVPLIPLVFSGYCQALEFPLFDARVAGMGGVGIAQGISNAAIYNPALAALEPEGFDWLLVAPAAGEFEADPSNIKGTLESAGDPTELDEKLYLKKTHKNLQLTIPSPTLGGMLYVMEFEHQTAKVTGTDLNHRSLEVTEIGFGVSRLVNFLWMDNLLFGVTGKMSLLKSFGYSEAFASASLELDDSMAQRDSELNIDFGFSKEYGVWKTGLVFKNIFSQENDLGSSGDTYSLGPQIRGALAYQSRRIAMELDIDFMKNKGVGYSSDTMNAAFGWEWRMFPILYLRLGYTQNLIEDQKASFSAGLGIRMWSLLLDGAFVADEDGEGVYANASWEL